MKIKDSTITFWFQKQLEPKIFVDKFNEGLSENFSLFNIIDVPSNIDALIPRLTSFSKSNHSCIEVSQINVRFRTNFDDNYSSDINQCLEYIKDRTLKLFDILKKCNIDVVYSAIFINLEKKEDNAVEKINKQFLKLEDSKLDEIGIRMSKIINNKFYCNVCFNSSVQVKIEKEFENNHAEIILPLVSLSDTKEAIKYLNVSIELTDKLAYNLDSSYYTSNEELLELFDLVLSKLKKEINRF